MPDEPAGITSARGGFAESQARQWIGCDSSLTGNWSSPRSSGNGVDSEDRMSFRTGDSVLHRPTGEKWFAWADENEAICCGWPETMVLAPDCEPIRAATDEQHWKLVEETRNPARSRQQRCFALSCGIRPECGGMMHDNRREAGDGARPCG